MYSKLEKRLVNNLVSYDLEYNFFGSLGLVQKKTVESFGVEFECAEHCWR